MTKDEALKMAIEALISMDYLGKTKSDSIYYRDERFGDDDQLAEVINACKEALNTEQVREAQQPIGYVDVEQFKRWEALKGTQYESVERTMLPFSTTPYKDNLTDCSLPIYTTQPLIDDLKALRGFAQAMIIDDGSTYIGDLDWEYIEEQALKFGLLREQQMLEPCGKSENDFCLCASEGIEFPTTCFRHTDRLKGGNDE